MAQLMAVLFHWKGVYLKHKIRKLVGFMLFLLCFLIMSGPAYATGEGNVDGGAASVSA